MEDIHGAVKSESRDIINNSPSPRKIILEQRVFGSEHEWSLDLSNDSKKNRDDIDDDYRKIMHNILKASRIKCPNIGPDMDNENEIFLFNGGLRYKEQVGLLESCSPEENNVLDLIRHERAEEIEIAELAKAAGVDKVYKTTCGYDCDRLESAGSHQNLSCRLPPTVEERDKLLIWAVVEKLITGCGFLHKNGDYYISPRAQFATTGIGGNTTQNRSLLNLKNEPLHNIEKYERETYRLHHISNDANVIDWARALKFILWQCVLQLAEEDSLPKIPYWDVNDDSHREQGTIKDIQRLSAHHRTSDNWILMGAPSEYMHALNVLSKYREAFKVELSGQSSLIDRGIEKFGTIIERLWKIDKEPYALFGDLDWATRRWFVENAMGDMDLPATHHKIQSISLEYGRVGSEMVGYSMDSGLIERLVSVQDIDKERSSPRPPNTRAWIRGKLAQRYGAAPFKTDIKIFLSWQRISIKENGMGFYYLDLSPCFRTFDDELDKVHLLLRDKIDYNRLRAGESKIYDAEYLEKLKKYKRIT